MSFRSKKTNKSKRSPLRSGGSRSSSSSRMSGAAAAYVNLSPVVEAEGEDTLSPVADPDGAYYLHRSMNVADFGDSVPAGGFDEGDWGSQHGRDRRQREEQEQRRHHEYRGERRQRRQQRLEEEQQYHERPCPSPIMDARALARDVVYDDDQGDYRREQRSRRRAPQHDDGSRSSRRSSSGRAEDEYRRRQEEEYRSARSQRHADQQRLKAASGSVSPPPFGSDDYSDLHDYPPRSKSRGRESKGRGSKGGEAGYDGYAQSESPRRRSKSKGRERRGREEKGYREGGGYSVASDPSLVHDSSEYRSKSSGRRRSNSAARRRSDSAGRRRSEASSRSGGDSSRPVQSDTSRRSGGNEYSRHGSGLNSSRHGSSSMDSSRHGTSSMDSSRHGSISADSSHRGADSSASDPAERSLMPLPGFEEADLLQRAIERRAVLHDRIVAMEAAKAEYERKNSGGRPLNRGGTEGEPGYQSTSMRHPPPDPAAAGPRRRKSADQRMGEYFRKGTDPYDNNDGDDDTPPGDRVGEHHQRMNELSERIKQEAQEFMSFESSYAERRDRLRHQAAAGQLVVFDESRRRRDFESSVELHDVSDDFEGERIEEGEQEEEEESHSASPSPGRAVGGDEGGRRSGRTSEGGEYPSPGSPLIDSSAWNDDDGGDALGGDGSDEDWKMSEQQHLRYSNMVRLQIPDAAVLRSMERDGIRDARAALRSLKEGHGASASAEGSEERGAQTTKGRRPSRDRQDVWERRGGADSSSSSGGEGVLYIENGEAETASPGKGGGKEDSERRLAVPLSEDPNYSKYFKMMKAKVPMSWVKRVLEVDGKDARVLDLDPDQPLKDQVEEGAVDKFGNVDWSRANFPGTLSIGSSRANSSGTHATPSLTASLTASVTENRSEEKEASADIPASTFASVKAELAAMTAKANRVTGGLSTVPSDEHDEDDDEVDDQVDTGPMQQSLPKPSSSHTPQTSVDIAKAAIAASNARMSRLRALRAENGGGDGAAGPTDRGRRRQTVDEIRRRLPPRPPEANVQAARKTHPQTGTLSQSSGGGGSKKSCDDPPLKDDPRFSKYFQMIRSRVPRSWVERVIEVDDRDPAILDLDPNKSLASQIGEDGADEMLGKDTDTVDSTYASLNTGSSRQSVTDATLDKSEHSQKPSDESGDGSETVDSQLPLTQIGNDEKNDDNRSEASSITGTIGIEEAERGYAQEEKSTIDLSKISSFLERIDAQINNREAEGVAEAPPSDDKQPTLRFNTAEEVENKLAQLLENFDANKLKEEEAADSEAPNNGMVLSEEQRQMVEKSQADIEKLSSLLASKIGQQLDASDRARSLSSQQQQATGDAKLLSDLENLPTLLSQVLEKMDQQPSADVPAENDSARKDSRNKALESLFAKRAALSEEEETKPKILREDPDYAKYFKMQKLGLPHGSVVQAMERDGKDVTVLDLDPNLPLAEQQRKAEAPADKNTALKALFSKRAAEMKQKEEAPDKNAALKALFAKRAAAEAAAEREGSAPPLKDDPEFQKYMRMLKVGMPKETVRQALLRDGKDISIADMYPEQSYASQAKKDEDETKKEEDKSSQIDTEEDSDPPLKEEYAKFFKMLKMGIPSGAVRQALQKEGKDPNIVDMDPEKSYASQIKKEDTDSDPPLKVEYAKFFKMLKMGIPSGAVRQALQKEGKDPNIVDMDPEKSYSSQIKKEDKDSDPPLKEEYAKFFKMLKMGIPNGAVRQALQKEGKDPNIVDMDPEKSYASQVKGKNDRDEEDTGPPLKDDPYYAKFFKMLKMGIPPGAVQNALKKEGKDPEIINMDPEKSYISQVKDKSEEDGPPIKDDPEYAKFFKMLKMGIPLGAVQNALKKDGKDTNVINLDPDKPLCQQQSKSKEIKKPVKPKPKVARKRLHWNKIDESKLHEKSFWNQAKGQSSLQSLQIVGLDVDNEEFASLFTSPLNKNAAPKKEPAPDAKKASSKQKVQLIDSRRRMNGSILLTKFKVDYKVLAKQVDNMEYVEADGNELRGMMQLLPTKDESLALRSYLPPSDAPQSEIDESIAKLGECEQYMAVMLDVPDAQDKFQCMLFRAEFESQADTIRDGTKMLIQACNSVKESERFRKLLLYALKLGNALNTGGANEEVTAITLDSLLKLAEAKAFDRKTSVLHYLVSIVEKNDEDVLKLLEDFGPVKAAERVAMDMLAQLLRDMDKGINLLKDVAKRYLPKVEAPADEIAEDELLGATPMGRFSLSAASKIQSLSNEFDEAKSNFADLLQFFGEDTTMTPEAFFCTINTFVSMFDQTYKELKRKREAKERKKRIEEKRKLREQEMAAKKIKSK